VENLSTLCHKLKERPAWLIAPGVFILTLLPLGAFHTRFGLYSLMASAVWIGLSLIVYVYFMAFRSFGSRITWPPVSARVAQHIHQLSERRFQMLIICIPVLLALFLGVVRWEHLPVVEDSAAQYAHAKLLAKGMLSAPAHPMPEFFQYTHVMDQGRWYSNYQLGHLLMLALGHLIGMVWLIDPLLCGASVWLAYRIARDHYRLPVARTTGMLAAFCPLWWDMASEYMNHNTSLFAVLLFVWAWLRMMKHAHWGYAMLAGLGLGLAAITRPLTAIAIAIPFIVSGLWTLRRQILSQWRTLAAFGTVCALLLAWQLYFNRQTTGDWLLFANKALYGDMVSLGFGHPITSGNFGAFYVGTVHTLPRGIGNISNNLIGVNIFLFNWPIPSLLFVFLSILVFRPDRLLATMLVSWFLLCALYVFYFFQDWCFGPRYMHEITGFLIIAAAIGISRAPATLRMLGCRARRHVLLADVRLLLTLCYLGAVPLWLADIPFEWSYCRPLSGPTATEMDRRIPDHSLVFVGKESFFKFGIFLPPLDSNRVIYAHDLGKHNKKLMDYYPDRSVYVESTEGVFKRIR
jgi:hypothetical protein